jgi:hypothetical protein
MRVGVFMKIEYPTMGNDYTVPATTDEGYDEDPVGALSLCKYLKGSGANLNMGPAVTAFKALPEVAASVIVSIECTPALFDAYRASSTPAGTIAYWLSAPAAEVDALEAALEGFMCDDPTACDTSKPIVDALEAQFDISLGLTGVDTTTIVFASNTFLFYDKAWTIPLEKFQDVTTCWDANGVSEGWEILPGYTAGMWKNTEMKPETHMSTPVLRWSDFSPSTDNFPIPRGCFPDETTFGSKSNPAMVKKGAHIELLGADCVGNRTENEMMRLCMTVCAYTDYAGPGTFDNRCIGVNWDEHG